MIDYSPEKCECCGQSTTYVLAIDKGSTDIVKGVARAIEKKGINCVHVNKELVGKYLTPLQMTNMTRPRSHGLIAHVEGEGMKGNYLLTKKGMDFLKGKRVPKYAIISKTEHRQIGYHEPETLTTTIHECQGKGEYWEGIGYEIEEGRVVHLKEVSKTLF